MIPVPYNVRQTLRQVYVIVLGLDVLGNPYGLISGIGEGVKDLFYEPYQVRYSRGKAMANQTTEPITHQLRVKHKHCYAMQ